MKTCKKCSESKPRTEFYRRAANKDGLNDKCKECARTEAREAYRTKHGVEPKESLPEGSKRCTQCQEVKKSDAFHKGKAQCRDCVREYTTQRYAERGEFMKKAHRERYRSDPEYRERVKAYYKKSSIKCKYGLAWEQYQELVGAGCAICGVRESVMAVDHDHSCCPGEKSCGACVRGVLCRSHNLAIGLFKDNVDHLRAAIAYLNK